MKSGYLFSGPCSCMCPLWYNWEWKMHFFMTNQAGPFNALNGYQQGEQLHNVVVLKAILFICLPKGTEFVNPDNVIGFAPRLDAQTSLRLFPQFWGPLTLGGKLLATSCVCSIFHFKNGTQLRARRAAHMALKTCSKVQKQFRHNNSNFDCWDKGKKSKSFTVPKVTDALNGSKKTQQPCCWQGWILAKHPSN